jgi:serine/threonine protein kinase
MRLESLPGSVLDQKYRIESRLGEGAMGAVFRATHLGTWRPVALKVIVPQLAENQEFAQRFKREAEAAGRLTHPNVINVTDFGVTRVDEQDLAYLVMEYLDGESLADYLKKTPRPTLNFLLDVMDQTALALDASHAAGIVHRDLKPSNIWLEPNHRGGYNVKVLDFGIAKVANPNEAERAVVADAVATLFMAPPEADFSPPFGFADASNPLVTPSSLTPSSLKTTAGSLLGTPAYMAPEQCTGLEVDTLADVYSLAVIAYQMLCGRLPFQGENLRELIKQQIQSVPESPREYDRTVPKALAEVVLSGLEKDPARRPPTAGTLAARLRATSDGELSPLRKSKDAFHTHLSPFMPVLLVCLSAVIVVLIAVKLAVSWAAHATRAPQSALYVLLTGCFCLFMLFGFQLFKAACTLILRHASEQGQFRSAAGAALKALAAGVGPLLRTQLVSVIDVRPSSWWANILWPVVWAAEGRSGRDAIARSRQLCGTLPAAAKSLAVRQYGPTLLATLVFPFMMTLLDSTGASLRTVMKEVLAGSFLGWFSFFYPMFFGLFFLNFGPAFSFFYWSALRCRNEGIEIALPAAARDGSRKSAASALRPATLLWAAIPLAMLALIVVRANVSASAQALDEASKDGRRMALLKLIDGGVGVEQMISDRETPLFDAVRGGDEKLVAELLRRGAKVNVQSSDGLTPLLLAAKSGRNELARVLLDRGALVDASDRDGRTPLMLAAMRGNEALVHLLVERGANVTRIDTQGKTASVYAREEGYSEPAGVLSQRLK